jgi:peptide/nickel transport system substrate-binding protein
MRSISKLGGIVVAACLCTATPVLAQKTGGILKIYHRENPPSASILEEATVSTIVPFMPVFNNLVVFDQHIAQNSVETIRPDLAKSWNWSADGRNLTFELEQGVKWHDGKPFTSKDVVCTFDLLTGAASQPLRSNPRASWYRNVDHVSTDGDYRVTVHLTRPQPSLLSMLASGLSPIYPCHVSPAQMRVKPIGTGPFKLAQFSEYQYIHLTRNTDYWKPGRPYLDGIDFNIVNNPSSAIVSFIAGRFDMTFPWEVTSEDLKTVKRDDPAAVCDTTSMNLNINLLVNRTRPPFDNADLRRALVLALDRKAIVDKVTNGDALIGGTMQPPPDGVWGLSPDLLVVVPGYGPDVARNREEARMMMQKQGYGPDRHLKLKLTVRGIPLYRDPAVVLRDQLREIYIDADLDIAETTLWFNRLRNKDYTLAVNATGNGIDDPDQTFYENFSCKSARNYTGYCNPEIEKMFDAQSIETNHDKRLQMTNEIDVRLLADGARPPIMWSRASTCKQPYVRGYTSMVNSYYNGFRFEDAWLDK